jgi:formylglycine-generating enzyme required for sulfatase activity
MHSCCSGLNREAASVDVAPSGRKVLRAARPDRLIHLPGGRVRIGTDAQLLPLDGEGPHRLVEIRPFAIDPFATTNRDFRTFVVQTGYVTEAARFGWSLVFRGFVPRVTQDMLSPDGPSWWCRVAGACWDHPEGPESGIADRLDHPVVHVSWNDAQACAQWAGGRLPSEAEWEHAASGGGAGRYPWGDGEPDDTFLPCNIWQGRFPRENTAADGHAGTAPVDAFAPNGFGLFNMVGNVWEWGADPFRIRSISKAAKARNARGDRLLKGGSYLCHRSYCHRYRIAARTGVSPDSSTGHAGFRLVYDL